MSDSSSSTGSVSDSVRESSIHSNAPIIGITEPTPTSFNQDVPVVTLAEQYVLHENVIAPELR